MTSAPIFPGDAGRFNDAEFFHDPYPLFKEMRELGPVVRVGERSHIAVGFDAVYDILRNHEQFSSDAASLPAEAREEDGDGMQIPIVLITTTHHAIPASEGSSTARSRLGVPPSSSRSSRASPTT